MLTAYDPSAGGSWLIIAMLIAQYAPASQPGAILFAERETGFDNVSWRTVVDRIAPETFAR
jgi:hypothetical protein